MNAIDVKQGSAEWRAARAGSLGASQVHDALAKTKSGWGASRENLLAELVLGRLLGDTPAGYTSDAMRWGTETEPQARAAYALQSGVEVVEVGLVQHPFIPNTHASPDGLVGDDGLIEIKCPNSATHLDTLLNGTIAPRYVTQVQWQLACTGRAWCDFVSFDPRFPEDMQIWVHRIEADPMRIVGLEVDISAFLHEVDQRLAQLLELRK